jgi:hypothetical protein
VIAVERDAPAAGDVLHQGHALFVHRFRIAVRIGGHAHVLDADGALVVVVIPHVVADRVLGDELRDAPSVGIDHVLDGFAAVPLQRGEARVPAALGVVDGDVLLAVVAEVVLVGAGAAVRAHLRRVHPLGDQRRIGRPEESRRRRCQGEAHRDLRVRREGDGLPVTSRERSAGAQDPEHAGHVVVAASGLSMAGERAHGVREVGRLARGRRELAKHADAGLGAQIGIGAEISLVALHELRAPS